jgi:hypothetical protein
MSLLARLDALLARDVRRLRARYQLSLDEFRGLYVSDEQVDALLAAQTDVGDNVAELIPPRGADGAWTTLARRFALSPLDEDVLLLGVAADLDPRYPPIFAYLNDDVALRWPTFDLARRLFGKEAARALAADGPLFGQRLVSVADKAGDRRALGLTPFAAAQGLADVLRGAPPRLPDGMRFAGPPADAAAQIPDALLPLLAEEKGRPLVLLCGDWGSGRKAAAMAGAKALGFGLIELTLPAGLNREELAQRLGDAVLHARMHGAALYIDVEAVTADAAFAVLTRAKLPVFLAAIHGGERWAMVLKQVPLAVLNFPAPDAAARALLWDAALAREGVGATPKAVARTADAYRLSPGRIAAAAAGARIAAQARRGSGSLIADDDLFAAARKHCALDLGTLAQPLSTDRGWGDLVLPAATMGQLREFANAVAHRERVFRGWGFAKPGAPMGLSALLAGSSGTGKTMSATVIAHETGLDLWRIDLSAVVSKYIGETEKHLDQIFRTARDGNAILFFDEADALFGKRSEVKDAHDRYANIEISYLLQRLEGHDGVCLLATNLAKNVDAAFSRRIHAVIEFPLPDAALRETLWRRALSGAPVADDVDFAFVARQFQLPGGDIRVVSLDAAFLACGWDGPITMAILIRAIARQLQKQGRIPSATEFRHYYPLLGNEPRASVA